MEELRRLCKNGDRDEAMHSPPKNAKTLEEAGKELPLNLHRNCRPPDFISDFWSGREEISVNHLVEVIGVVT